MRSRRACGRCDNVRMLWSLSANLIITTRMSSDIATSILRVLAARASSGAVGVMPAILSIPLSLVTPSTSRATSYPNSSLSVSNSMPQSSTTSCIRAAAMVVASIFNSANSVAVAIGCSIYGSPDMRRWPR